jgi:D-alanyl-D-alanine dipeptidase
MKYLKEPIPELHASSALEYNKIPIIDNKFSQEPLVPISDFGLSGYCFYARKDGMNFPYGRALNGTSPIIYLRLSVCNKLKLINNLLSNIGHELFIWDGYRSIECQRSLWDYFISEVARRYGIKDYNKKVEKAGNYCSNPSSFNVDDSSTWPTHSTGGAVDLTIRVIETKELLFMGGVFDDATSISNTRYYEEEVKSNVDSANLSDTFLQALQNRRLLYWLMKNEGFANFSNEWWHYDYGTQMWVMNSNGNNISKAFYGTMPTPL